MTRLLDRIAWLAYCRCPLGSRLEKICANRVADAMLKRDFNP